MTDPNETDVTPEECEHRLLTGGGDDLYRCDFCGAILRDRFSAIPGRLAYEQRLDRTVVFPANIMFASSGERLDALETQVAELIAVVARLEAARLEGERE